MFHQQAIVLTLLALISASCTHAYQFTRDPEIGRLDAPALAERRIELDLVGAPENFDASANGHTFHVTGIRDSVNVMLSKMFADRIDTTQAPDTRLQVRLEFDLGAALLGVRATCRAECTFLDADGNKLSHGAGEGEAAYPVIANGGRNCELAMLQALPAALDAALAGL